MNFFFEEDEKPECDAPEILVFRTLFPLGYWTKIAWRLRTQRNPRLEKEWKTKSAATRRIFHWKLKTSNMNLELCSIENSKPGWDYSARNSRPFFSKKSAALHGPVRGGRDPRRWGAAGEVYSVMFPFLWRYFEGLRKSKRDELFLFTPPDA